MDPTGKNLESFWSASGAIIGLGTTMETASSSGVSSRRTASFPAPDPLWRFGNFEVDCQAEELRKNGVRLHLPGQPFQILTILLERAGEVVTREELRQWLWPEAPPADFDRSLNTAVNRLRGVLCDAAGTVRYIETLPRKGYRFVAPVERLVRPAKSAAVPESALPPAAAAREPVSRPVRNTHVLTLVMAAGALIVATWIISRQAPAPNAAHVVALTDYPGAETTPSWSPDGTRVAFSWDGGKGNNLDVYALEVGSPAPERLTDSTGNEFAPRYSPDGRRIAFYRRAGDSAYLHIISAGQRNLVRSAGFGLNVGPDVPFPARLAVAPAPDLAFLSWSPDAKDIAYVDKSSPGEPFSVFLLSVAGWRGEKITWPPAGIRGDGSPAFSPDGRQLAFVRSQNEASADLFILPLDGGSARRLTWDNCRISGIAWTSGGKAIVFSSERSGEPGLWRISMPGAVLERIQQVREPAVLPAIAENGDALAFARWPERQEIVRVPLPAPAAAPDSPTAERFNADASNPEFSPSGTKVAFSSGSGGGTGIWVSDATGGNAIRLTRADRYSASPKWSPDGRFIAFDGRALAGSGAYDIFVMDAAGGTPRALTSGPMQNSRPAWSADGRSIYFASDRSGTLQIWKMAATGGAARQITRNGGSEAEESPDGKTLYYSRRAVPGLWSTPAAGGEETLILKDLQWENSRNWIVAQDGIYYLAREGNRPSEWKYSLKQYRFQDRAVRHIASLRGASVLNGRCSLSPDRHTFLYVQQQRTETDLAILKGFR